MLVQWLHVNPIAHGGLILLFGTLLGYVVSGIDQNRPRQNLCFPSTAESPALRRIWLPLILTTIAIFADDAIERAGLRKYFWWDEFLAILQSLPVIAWTWQMVGICRFYFSRLTDQHTEETNVVYSLTLVSNLITILIIYCYGSGPLISPHC
jgi:hypothetical protein